MSLLSAHTQCLNPTATIHNPFSPSSQLSIHESSFSSKQTPFCRGQFNIRLVLNHVLPVCVMPLTEENVEKVLEEVWPGLMADGGNVALHEIDGLIVVLKLQGACGSCPSSTMTLKMGIKTRLKDKIPEILDVEQILDTETGLELNDENIEKVLAEIRPYLAGDRRWCARARAD